MYLHLHPQSQKQKRKVFSNVLRCTADVAKLVDALDLGSSAARHGGSSPSIRTITEPSITRLFTAS